MKNIKVVYNACFGGFSLSRKAVERLVQLGYDEAINEIEAHSKYEYLEDSYSLSGLSRHDSRLVQVVEEFGKEAGGRHARLKVAEISGNKYRIDEYDGSESVQTPEDIDWIEVE